MKTQNSRPLKPSVNSTVWSVRHLTRSKFPPLSSFSVFGVRLRRVVSTRHLRVSSRTNRWDQFTEQSGTTTGTQTYHLCQLPWTHVLIHRLCVGNWEKRGIRYRLIRDCVLTQWWFRVNTFGKKEKFNVNI